MVHAVSQWASEAGGLRACENIVVPLLRAACPEPGVFAGGNASLLLRLTGRRRDMYLPSHYISLPLFFFFSFFFSQRRL